ncbi:MAG: hypothetical protein D6712_10740 [Chloroflexi bacterium]|nr:MAG: hypothetical protein D6712_10740 [Chloroflexota bacterium]
MLNALGLIPPEFYDLLWRAWPAILIFFGLSWLLHGRVRFAHMLSLVASGALVIGIGTWAFASRTSQYREDNQFTHVQEVDDVLLLIVNVETLATDVEFRSSEDGAIHVEFVGSLESVLTPEYIFDDALPDRATFNLKETRPHQFPLLENIGRGRLVIELPTEIALDVAFAGEDGDASFNMGDMALERLNINLQQGDALVTLPAYSPLAPNIADDPGDLVVRNGDITIFVPSSVGGHFELNRNGSGIQPEYDPSLYNLLVGDVLESRTFDTADIQIRYIITVPRGVIRLVVQER